MQGKHCARCHCLRPLSDFRWLLRHDRGKDERFRDAWCGDCRRAYKRLPDQRAKASARAWIKTQRDPEKRERGRQASQSYYERNRAKVLAGMRQKGRAGGWLNNRIKRKFGIDLVEYERLVQAQAGLCALCGQPDRTKQRRLAVDHCHETLKIRGLLCHHCNTGLGNFMDDVELLRRAIAYLEASA